MNTVCTSVRKNQNLPMSWLLNSLYYASPVGMFLTACNFMFEFVRNYYFNWWIVVLPTVGILVVSNVYEAVLIYQKGERILFQEKNILISKSNDYAVSKSKMVSELV